MLLSKFLLVMATAFPLLLSAVGWESEIDSARRHEVVEAVCEKLIEGYIYEDQGRQLAEWIRGRRDAGHYDELNSDEAFAGALSRDLREQSNDLHLEVISRPPVPESKGPTQRPTPQRSFFRSVNYGLPKLEVMKGNVGYLELLAFMGMPEAVERVDHAFGLLQDVDALIIDLRRNGGGEESMLRRFSTYLFDEETVLVTNWKRGMKEPKDVVTLDLPGPRLGQVPLFVLTSEKTCSAAEAFTFAMKINQRATLIGETTAGGGHFGGPVPLDDGFMLWLPHGRAYDKKTGKGFEAEGIEPHIQVPKEEALERALAEARQAATAFAAAREAREAAIRAEVNAATAAAKALAGAGDLTSGAERLQAGLQVAQDAELLSEAGINRLGYEMLQDGFDQLAIMVFQRNVELFPASFNVYDSLGEAYLAAGDTARAIFNYEKSVSLDPENRNGVEVLRSLRARE